MLNSIYLVPSVRTTINTHQLHELVEFLTKNRDLVLQGDELNALLTSRSLAPSPITAAYGRLMETGQLGQYAFLRVPKGGAAVPEVLVYTHVPYDIKQIEAVDHNLAGAVRAFPSLDGKIIVNVSSMVRADGTLADPAGFPAMVVRNALSRSYFNSRQDWLIPQLVQQICGVYSMSVSAALQRAWNLTYLDQQRIATLFAYYYWQLCASPEDAARAVQSHARELQLGEPAQVADLIQVADAHRPEGGRLSLDQICRAVEDLGIGRLHCSRRILNNLLRFIAGDMQSSVILLEYPPYLAAAMLMAASGYHIGLATTIKMLKLHRMVDAFVDLLPRAPGFADKIATEGLVSAAPDESAPLALAARLQALGFDDPRLLALAATAPAELEPLICRYEEISGGRTTHVATEGLLGTIRGLFARRASSVTPADITALLKSTTNLIEDSHMLVRHLHKDFGSETFGANFSAQEKRSVVTAPVFTAKGAAEMLTFCGRLTGIVKTLDHAIMSAATLEAAVVAADRLVKTAGAPVQLSVTAHGLAHTYKRHTASDYIGKPGATVGGLGYTSAGQILKLADQAMAHTNSIYPIMQDFGQSMLHLRNAAAAKDPLHNKKAQLLWQVGRGLLWELLLTIPNHIMEDFFHVHAALETHPSE